MKNAQSNKEDTKKKVTDGRDTGLGRDPKRESLPISDELEITKSQKGKKVDGDPEKESDKPANL